MDNNGIAAIYDLDDYEDSSAKAVVKQYIEELSNFNNDTGKEFLSELRDKKSDVYKNYTDNKKRNYRNWQKGTRIERNNLIELCFDYHITELDEINNLLYAFNYEALHLRDVSDLVYYFALKNGISYVEAKEKSNEYKEKFEKEFGKESGESRRTSTGIYTCIVLENVNVTTTWQDLEDYIEKNKSKLGRIKITAYKKLKNFIKEFEEEKEDRNIRHSKRTYRDNPFYDTKEIELSQSLIYKIRTSMGLPEKGKDMNLYQFLHRTKSISRGVFILYEMKIIFEEMKENYRAMNLSDFITELNKELYVCTFAQLNPKRSLWDKIVYDCIEAAFDVGLYYDDDSATPYALAIMFLEYIQNPEK